MFHVSGGPWLTSPFSIFMLLGKVLQANFQDHPVAISNQPTKIQCMKTLPWSLTANPKNWWFVSVLWFEMGNWGYNPYFPALGDVVKNHGFSFQMAMISWLINGDDPNHLHQLGWYSKYGKRSTFVEMCYQACHVSFLRGWYGWCFLSSLHKKEKTSP